jgi:hypothetical protein
VFRPKSFSDCSDFSEGNLMARRQFQRIAKWIGTVLCAIILGAWLISVPTIADARLWIQRLDYRSECSLALGAVLWVSISQPLLDEPILDAGWDMARIDGKNREHYGLVSPRLNLIPSFEVCIPLWLPFIIFGFPTVFFWYRDRRRFPAGYCQKCGYDLTGNVSGICPECGTVTTSRAVEGDTSDRILR